MTRANPPGKAGTDDKRRHVYQAALEQFEELFAAARVAGSAARPLPLFYALSQAGRAIAAAHAPGEWVLRGHGLKTDIREPVTKTKVRPEGVGSFGAVSTITSSPPLEEPVELGALWMSLPDLADTALPDSEWHQALYFGRSDVGHIEGAGPIRAAVVLGWTAKSEQPIIEKLSHYPAAEGGSLDTQPGAPPLHLETPRGLGLLMSWSGTDEFGQTYRTMDDVAPEYRYHRERWIRPALGSEYATLSPLMTWWALLFGFSMLARYEPAAWVAALDLNVSAIAVHVADALEEALDAVPQLVLEALHRQPFLRWRPVPGAT